MRCTSPRRVGFKADGKTISFSPFKFSPEYVGFQVPCGYCLACRLERGRQWAVRAVHEAKMHRENSFITLTYRPECLPGPRVIYSDFQEFMKSLRSRLDYAGIDHQIGYLVVGEYGADNKRPHWHACLFGWSPNVVPVGYSEPKKAYKNELGDQVFTSDFLDEVWGKGMCDFGSVTFKSAGYCARYAAKKLVHGKDNDHEFHPVFKVSSKYAIGRSWLEKYWRDVFNHGRCEVNGVSCSIPRYYEKWFKREHPDEWIRYVTEVKSKVCFDSSVKADLDFWERRSGGGRVSRERAERLILEGNFNRLQDNLKL